MARNGSLAAEAAKLLHEALGGAVSAPGEMRGAMASLCFRARQDAVEESTTIRARARQAGVVIAAGGLGGFVYVRASAQLYNQLSDYERCAAVLRDIGVS
jgi:selenocysteine lyase/cysteine desulfurase